MFDIKIYIDPHVKILYASFYIHGLYEVFGRRNVTFSAKYFKTLNRKDEPYSFDHYMSFVIVRSNEVVSKIVIDFHDSFTVKLLAYDWCDSYAKINFNFLKTRKAFHSKIIPIPPGFGIRIWNLSETLYHGFLNLFKCEFKPTVSIFEFLGSYYSQYKRALIRNYERDINMSISEEALKPYVYLMGTLWEDHGMDANSYRQEFIKCCREANCDFEGGLVANPNHKYYLKFKDFIFKERVTIREYIGRTMKSWIVFNSPVVYNCHGWKLAEYLAMGKAVISIALYNHLPVGLIHKSNIHFINKPSEIKTALKLLLINANYRKSLEEGAVEYFSEYASPSAVVSAIWNSIGINKNGTF